MKKRRTWWIAGSTIAGVWLVVMVLLWALRAAEVTPESVLAFLRGTAWGEMSEADRLAAIDALARQVNRLPARDKMDPALGEAVRSAFDGMTDGERTRYLDQTLPQGMEEMMNALNAMSREERQSLVDRAMRDLDEQVARGAPPPNDAATQRIIDEGMRSYLSDANAEAKLDLQPLVQQMQGLLRRAGR